MKKLVALPLITALALLLATSAKADGTAAATSVSVTAASATVDAPAEQYLDGSWTVDGYDEHKYAVATSNQKTYEQAKKDGDWVKAEAYTPLTFVKGWMHLNQARDLKYASWTTKDKAGDVEGLKKAKTLYEEAKAIGEAAQAVNDPRGEELTAKSKEQGEKIVAQADDNIAKIDKEIDTIEHPPVKKSRRAKKAEAAKEDE